MAVYQKMEWNDKYNTGVKRFDIQHRGLFDRINTIIEDYNENADDDSFMLHVRYLMVYADNHLVDEEEVMMAQYYPHFSEHKKLHDEFREKSKEFMRLFDIGHLEKERFIEFLIQWWSGHILNEDMDYKDQFPNG